MTGFEPAIKSHPMLDVHQSRARLAEVSTSAKELSGWGTPGRYFIVQIRASGAGIRVQAGCPREAQGHSDRVRHASANSPRSRNNSPASGRAPTIGALANAPPDLPTHEISGLGARRQSFPATDYTCLSGADKEMHYCHTFEIIFRFERNCCPGSFQKRISACLGQ